MQIDLPDRIERARAQWADEEPGLDTSPMEVIGRILRAAHLADTRIRRVLRQESLDRSGFDVLATLRRSGPPYRLTPTALYRDLVLTSGTGWTRWPGPGWWSAYPALATAAAASSASPPGASRWPIARWRPI
jgi:hypothetical protein